MECHFFQEMANLSSLTNDKTRKRWERQNQEKHRAKLARGKHPCQTVFRGGLRLLQDRRRQRTDFSGESGHGGRLGRFRRGAYGWRCGGGAAFRVQGGGAAALLPPGVEAC